LEVFGVKDFLNNFSSLHILSTFFPPPTTDLVFDPLHASKFCGDIMAWCMMV
jgi:hypothetical protein